MKIQTTNQRFCLLTGILGLDEGNQRLVVWAVVFICDESGIIHGSPGFLSKSNKENQSVGQRINIA